MQDDDLADNSVLDEILKSEAPAEGEKDTAATTAETTPATTTTAPAVKTDETGRLHGADGKFAPKAGEPAAPTTAAAAAPADGATDPATAAQPEAGGGEGKMVPLAVVTAERERRQDLERQVQVLMQRLTQPAAPAAPKEEPKPRPAVWEDPDGWGQSLIQEAVAPFQQSLQRTQLRLSRSEAIRAHGEETVTAAFAALKEAVNAGELTEADVAAQAKGDDFFGQLVGWHRQRETQRKVGNDPDAWLKAEIEKRIADPAFQAQVIEVARGAVANGNGKAGQQPPVALPPSLTRVPGGANQPADNDVSSEALFKFATARG